MLARKLSSIRASNSVSERIASPVRRVWRSIMRTFFLVLPAVLSLAAAAVPSVIEDETSAHGDAIHMANFYFCDPSFQGSICDRTFVVGSEVAWEVFQDAHTITECDDTFTVCPPAGGFDFGFVYNGDSRFRVFNEVGVYEYRCNFHPDQMRGRLIVQAQTAATPTQGATAGPTPVGPTSAPGAAPTPAPSPVTAAGPAQPGSTLARAATPASVGGAAVAPAAGGGDLPAPRSVWHPLLVLFGALTLLASGAISLHLSRRL